MYMIHLNAIFCNLIKNKKSAITLINECLVSVNLSREVCPHCGSKGNCKEYGRYTRNIVDYFHGEIVSSTVDIPRVICTSCSGKHGKCTHALLPDVIVPYAEYSLFFILNVLLLYYCRQKKLSEICEQFGIAPVQFYRWKRLFEKHQKEWLGILKSLESASVFWLHYLRRLDQYSCRFSTPFLHKTGRSFLQGHMNPANCRYPRFPVT